MKRKILVGMAVLAVIGLNGCGKQDLSLVSQKIEVELGSVLSDKVTDYVKLDEKSAAEAAVDFSAVNLMKTGTYTAAVTYGEQAASFEVVVKDTTAPVVGVKDDVIITAGETLQAEDIITNVNELSGEVTVAFKEAVAADASTEAVDGTEMVDATEKAEPEEEVFPETSSFVIGDVTCNNAEIVYSEIGEYDTALTVADASGNSTEVPVHIVVGESPVFNGIEDITVTAGTAEVNYLDGITATDCNGNDITDKIVCDSSAVDLNTAGTYEITYTVTDKDGFQGTVKVNVTVTEGKSDTAKKDTTSKGSDSKGKTITSSNSKAGASSTGKTSDNSNASGNNNSSNNSNTGSQTTPDKDSNSSSGENNNGGGQTPAPTPTPDKGGSSSNNGNNNGGSTPTPTPAPTPTPTPTPAPAPAPDSGNNGGGSISDENQQMQDQIDDWGEVFDPSTNPDKTDEMGGTGW